MSKKEKGGHRISDVVTLAIIAPFPSPSNIIQLPSFVFYSVASKGSKNDKACYMSTVENWVFLFV